METFLPHQEDRESLARAVADLDTRSVFGPSVPAAHDLTLRLFYVKRDIRATISLLLEADAQALAELSIILAATTPESIVQGYRESSTLFPALDRLSILYKSFFFFTRAFQDLAYGVLLTIHGQQAGSFSSMQDCLKTKPSRPTNNPVAKLIAEHAPEYPAWFDRFRALRNQIKEGRGNGADTHGGRLRVAIDLQKHDVSERKALLGLPDITEAISMSCRLFDIMRIASRAALAAQESDSADSA